MAIITSESKADLHCHTTASDGMLTPGQVVELAMEAGLRAVAITDHDCADGVAPARLAAGAAIEVVAGIEISSHVGGREVHMLGLFVDPEAPGLLRLCAQQRGWRRERAELMVGRLQARGVEVSMGQVDEIAADAPIGRPHIAGAVIEAGAVDAAQDAFDLYLGNGRPAFVPKRSAPAADAIAVIHAAGGCAVIAHPGSSRIRERLIGEMAAAGLDGIEVRHPRHGSNRQRILMALCRRHGLLPSGGSDFHGPGRGDSRLGQHAVPLAWCEALRQRASTHRTAEFVEQLTI